MPAAIVLDQEEGSRDQILALLRGIGWTASAPSRWSEARRLARREPPALVLCDPISAGVRSVSRLQELGGDGPLPIVMLAGKVRPEELLRGAPIGVWLAGVLEKPLDPYALLALLVRAGLLKGWPALALDWPIPRPTGGPLAALAGLDLERGDAVLDLRWGDLIYAVRVHDGELIDVAAGGSPIDLAAWAARRGYGEEIPRSGPAPSLSAQVASGTTLPELPLPERRLLARELAASVIADAISEEQVGIRVRPPSGDVSLDGPSLGPVGSLGLLALGLIQARSPERFAWSDTTEVRAAAGARRDPASWRLPRHHAVLVERLLAALGAPQTTDALLAALDLDPEGSEEARLLLSWLVAVGGARLERAGCYEREGPGQRELYEVLARTASESPFEALGVGPDAEDAEIRRAFLALTRSYHPDRYFQRHDRVVGVVGEIQQRASAAYDRIRDAEARAALQAANAPLEDTGAAPQRARSHLLQGQHFLRQKAWAKALEQFERATELDPSDPAGRALAHWATFVSDSSARARVLPQHTVLMRDHPEYAEGWYLLGRMLRLAGRADRAEQVYRRALALDPNHVGAQRELRLVRRRAEEQGDEGEGSGWFGRASGYFKKA